MEQRRYNVGLDFIRIFAMFAVIWVHLTVYLPVPDRIRPFFTWGGGRRSVLLCSERLSCMPFI